MQKVIIDTSKKRILSEKPIQEKRNTKVDELFEFGDGIDILELIYYIPSATIISPNNVVIIPLEIIERYSQMYIIV